MKKKEWFVCIKAKGRPDEEAWWEKCSWCENCGTREEAEKQAVACVNWFNETLRLGERERVFVDVKEKREKMVKCEVKATIVNEVILSMSEQEAQALQDVLGSVEGSKQMSRRRFTDKVWASMVDVLPNRNPGCSADLVGVLRFLDAEEKQETEEGKQRYHVAEEFPS